MIRRKCDGYLDGGGARVKIRKSLGEFFSAGRAINSDPESNARSPSNMIFKPRGQNNGQQKKRQK